MFTQEVWGENKGVCVCDSALVAMKRFEQSKGDMKSELKDSCDQRECFATCAPPDCAIYPIPYHSTFNFQPATPTVATVLWPTFETCLLSYKIRHFILPDLFCSDMGLGIECPYWD